MFQILIIHVIIIINIIMITNIYKVFIKYQQLLESFGMHACSVLSDSVTPWAVARQAPVSYEFFRQEY